MMRLFAVLLSAAFVVGCGGKGGEAVAPEPVESKAVPNPATRAFDELTNGNDYKSTGPVESPVPQLKPPGDNSGMP